MATVVVAPAVAARNPRVMPPWEVLGLALLPVLVRALFGGELGTFATYLAIAAFALIITVELQMFTTLRVTHWFAVVFVVLTTMATAAAWTVLRWNADRLLGTGFLTTNDALMMEWIYVTLAGLVAGVLFDAYFRRRGARLRRAIGRVVRR
jgi:peptidoglycan biosynthesis protein MviN/MurJ (putative lipid II flippase)